LSAKNGKSSKDVVMQSAEEFTSKSVDIIVVREQSAIGSTSAQVATQLRAIFELSRPTEQSYSVLNDNPVSIQTVKDLEGPISEYKPGLVVGLLDKRIVGLSDEKIPIAKQLREHVDRKARIPLLAVQDRDELRKLFKAHESVTAYLPLNLRLKANYMLGGTNFKPTSPLIPNSKIS
jgi:hypothetical protein